MKTLPHVDVAIIGGGWTGLLMAKELGTRTGHTVAVFERGSRRDASQYQGAMDEIDFSIRFRIMQDLAKETVTLRRDLKERALPIRRDGALIHCGDGTGGSGEHWNGTCFRGQPEGFQVLTRSIEKYGRNRLPEDHEYKDWPISYGDLEPHYTRMERMIGVSGKAGILQGKPIVGGNPFEGNRSSEYPTPPLKMPYISDMFGKAAASLGYHPYPVPAATISKDYTNPDGVSRAGCEYCGFCVGFGCMIGSKGQPTTVLMPVIEKRKNVSVRTGSSVRRIVLTGKGNSGKAAGVVYRDSSGEEFFQPADLVILATWTLNNTRLLLLSGIGHPYNPSTGEGTLGRNLTHQMGGGVGASYSKPLNGFMGAGAAGIAMSDFQGDAFDHSKLDFLRGGVVMVLGAGEKPAEHFGAVPPSVKARWGSEWKKAAIAYWDHSAGVGMLGEMMPHKTNYMDLDPTWTDEYGDPLLRATINYHDNDRRIVAYMVPKLAEIAKAMGAAQVMVPTTGLGDYDARRAGGTHVHGGTIMGTSKENSVVNHYQQHWDVPNLFVVGPSVFPELSIANAPTLTVLATTSRAADAVIEKYLKQPGPLA